MKKSDLTTILIITILISFFCGTTLTYMLLFSQNNNQNTIIKNNTQIVLNEDYSIEKGIANVYDAVVVIEGYSQKQMISTGTGFIYKKDGSNAYIMTNHHVISSSDKVKVILSDKTELDASISGSETYSDIAVLKIKADKIKQVANIGQSTELRIGDTLFAVGSPEGVDYAGTVTKGILSSKERLVEVALDGSNSNDYYMKVLQTDVAINPGNSGGPICDINGNVVGITNMKLVDSTVEGMGFAIPIEDALSYAKTLEKDGKIKRPYIGISMLDVENSFYLWEKGITIPNNIKSGVVVYEVTDNSPASKANLKKGDIITKIDNKSISSLAEFRYTLYKYKPSDTIKVTYIRNNKEKKTDIKLEENPNETK